MARKKKNMTLKEKILRYLEIVQNSKQILETRKIEFKETYKLRKSGKINKAVRAELVRDVVSLANSLPDPEEETGFLFLGVKRNGQVVNNYKMPLNDVAEWNSLINSLLERPITFYYREYTDRLSKNEFGVIIIPKSIHKPHLIRQDFRNNKGKILLRRGECWTRIEGGKRIAFASDYDEIYREKADIQKVEKSKAEKETAEKITKMKKIKKNREIIEKIYNMTEEELNKLSRKIFK